MPCEFAFFSKNIVKNIKVQDITHMNFKYSNLLYFPSGQSLAAASVVFCIVL